MNLTLLNAIDQSLYNLTGLPLPSPKELPNRFAWIHIHSDYALLAHSHTEEPVFIYANELALQTFNYDQNEFLGMPSKKSASAIHQSERAHQLAGVEKRDIVFGYEGVRVDKLGQPFHIYDGIIWNINDADGHPLGQAALFWQDKQRRPDWYKLPG